MCDRAPLAVCLAIKQTTKSGGLFVKVTNDHLRAVTPVRVLTWPVSQ